MKIQTLLEVKAGRFNSPMVGQTVKIMTKDGGSFGKGNHQGQTGTVTHAERVHTFSQMVPFVIEYRIDLDDGGDAVYYRREAVKKVNQISEGERFYFFIDGDKNGKGPWTVMTSKGDQHDTYRSYKDAVKAKDKLNAEYGKD